MQRARQVDVFALPFSPAYDYNALKSFNFNGQKYRPGDPFPKNDEGARVERYPGTTDVQAPHNGKPICDDALLLKLFKARQVYPLIPGVNIDESGTITNDVAAARMGLNQARPGAAGSASAPAGGKQAIHNPPNASAGHPQAERPLDVTQAEDEVANEVVSANEDDDLDPSETGGDEGAPSIPFVPEEAGDLDPSERAETEAAAEAAAEAPHPVAKAPIPTTLQLGPGAEPPPPAEPPTPPAPEKGAKPWSKVHKGFGKWTILDAAGEPMRENLDKATAEAAVSSGVLPQD